ncbi:MAG: hypothetical protein Q9175_005887 [Cornicularia normoerica]
MAVEAFDFIIVGGGTAGCALASKLSGARKNYQVLLLEAGGTNSNPDYQTYGERHWTLATAPGYNWGYKTVPQTQLDREIDQSRGKGLGGSSAINFCVYTRGPRADYDHWAEQIEYFHKPPQEQQHWVNPTRSAHGDHGAVDVGLTDWEPEFGDFVDGLYNCYPKNLDVNSGDPLGVAVCQVSARGGRRATASDAYLSDVPSNLTIITDATVETILFDQGKTVGVTTNKGKHIRANMEVILSAGALDSPKLLLLSGIGPEAELSKLHIPIVKDLPGVGKNLCDRLFLELVSIRAAGSHYRTSYITSPDELYEARKQWIKDRSGPLAGYYLPQMIGYFKSDKVIQSEEFQRLDSELQRPLFAETKPHYEIVSHNPSPTVQAPDKYIGIAAAFEGNYAARGSVTLKSADSKDPPVIDPKFLAEPFDRRVAIEAVRETLKLLDLPHIAKEQVRLAAGPEDRSDEAILNYVRKTAISMWHCSGTVRMGKKKEPGTCVDSNFQVCGVDGLRVVDMSVAPFLLRLSLFLSAHTQAAAYLIGETAAEKIIAEYN